MKTHHQLLQSHLRRSGVTPDASLPRSAKLCSAVLAASLLVACGSDKDNKSQSIPMNLGTIQSASYSGDDGLLAGLGLSGLQGAAPGYVDAANPTLTELRRNTIYANYTALVDQSANGGFGSVYGPTDDTHYPGTEYFAFVGEGLNRATLLVQIPDSFDTSNPCIIAGPASGSRGVYGAIGTAGAWAIEHGCAAALTDMNKGTGAVDLTRQLGFGIQINALSLDTDEELTFRVPTQENVATDSLDEYAGVTLPTQAEVDAYTSANPHRYAFKHLHSQKNIEKDWGLHTLQSIKFALQQLNSHFTEADQFTAANTLVIAASVSNGGSGVVRAAEQDVENLIDAVVAGEPNVIPASAPESFDIRVGERVISNHSKSSYEYFAYAELFAACAGDDPELTSTALKDLRGDASPRCQSLVDAGLLTAGSATELGQQASARLLAAGFTPESMIVAAGYGSIDIYQSLVTGYANQFTRSSVIDAVCDVSMGVVDGNGHPASNSEAATLATTSNGIPRTANLVLIKDDDNSGQATVQHSATSSNGRQDYNLEGALCYWDIFNNADNPLHQRLMTGLSEVEASGNLRGKPTILVHGRADALILPNHSSRPYVALNQQIEGSRSQLHYYEVTNAQHLDTLNQTYAALGGGEMEFVPLDYYFKQALELMYQHLTEGTALPPSQVVGTVAPTGGTITLANLPAISSSPAMPITFDGVDLVIE
ncbi:D-(-)-3-hydroxybutyrate oligomer hydrolase [Oceanobacter mangrovi]|uniref:D-(-)-3-hydroxybutyrate oligomer hydrolase n=1 Tax=Oceanobacter mangrovi TaxID=2862510 RepID=UPI001C8D4918|nr:D-(-)-3-hydroxybutyrate oligomer hydrolase [Oceanobacter mangrovi]